MIGLNWKKSLIVAGAMLALAAAVPAGVSAMTQAHTPDVLPLGTGMMDTPGAVLPVKKVSAKKLAAKKLATKKVASHKKATRKAALKHPKLKVSRKHTKLSTKKHTV